MELPLRGIIVLFGLWALVIVLVSMTTITYYTTIPENLTLNYTMKMPSTLASPRVSHDFVIEEREKEKYTFKNYSN